MGLSKDMVDKSYIKPLLYTRSNIFSMTEWPTHDYCVSPMGKWLAFQTNPKSAMNNYKTNKYSLCS